MKYLQGTIGLPLILSMEKYGNIKWYVDSEFAVHKDIRIHTGGFMTMETGGKYFQSRKKLNTKSSIYDKLVGLDDFLTQVIWTQYFLKYQGYKNHENVFYQDNQSAIKLEKNGRKSSSKRNRHINNRYYLITDIITKQ